MISTGAVDLGLFFGTINIQQVSKCICEANSPASAFGHAHRSLRRPEREALMVDERTQHLEHIAAQLTQAYYTVHAQGSPDHADIVNNYFFFLEALQTHDTQKPGERPLAASDTLAPYEAESRED